MSNDVAVLAMDRAAQAQEAYRTHTNAANGWRDVAAKTQEPQKRRIYEELEHWQRRAASIALSSASQFARIAATSVDHRRRPGSLWSVMNDGLVARTNKVPCPECGAKEGRFCIGPHGEEKTTTNHYARRKDARAAGFVKGGRHRR
jgi:hypothetical protein